MTDTMELADVLASTTVASGVGVDAELEVEIWGPPASGKSALLASLYETLGQERDLDALAISPPLQRVHRHLLENPGTSMSDPSVDGPPSESLSVTLAPATDGDGATAGWRVRIVCRSDDDVQTGAAIDPTAWAAARAGKVVIACLNPFLLDADLAWKGLRHLVAVLQGPNVGHPLDQALAESANALFHVDADALLHRARLQALLPFVQQARIAYDAGQPDPELRFVWERVDPSVRQQLADELRRFIHEQVRLAAPMVNVIRRSLKQLDRVAVVLTHVDLVDALLPSVTSADLERVFATLFAARPDRAAHQQVLGRLFHVDVSSPFVPADDAAGRPRPTAAITGRLRTDGAAGLVHYLRAVVENGATHPNPADAPGIQGRMDGAERRLAKALADLEREAHARRELQSTIGELCAERDRIAERPSEQAAQRDEEIRTLRDERTRLERVIEAMREDNGRIPAMQQELADRAALAGDAGPVAELRAELDAARRRFEELRARTHDEIARRDESIQTLGQQIRACDLQIAEERNLRRTAEKGGLSDTEAREREAFESGRAGPIGLWAALLVRSLPAVPICAVLAAGIIRASSASMTFGHAFAVSSVAGVLVLVASLLAGVHLYWGDVGPRWVWFRSRNDKAGIFDVLTSAGERVQSPPREFSLELSPLLELLGIGVVRRSANGLTYATTEPDTWRANLGNDRVHRRWATDGLTIAIVLAWVVALIAVAA